MQLSEQARAFLEAARSAAMITLRRDAARTRCVWESREEFLQAMIDERRLIYEFDVIREYGLRQ